MWNVWCGFKAPEQSKYHHGQTVPSAPVSVPNNPLSFPALGHFTKDNTHIQKITLEFLKAIGKDRDLHMEFASFVDKWEE